MDGYIIIGTKLDNSEMDKDLQKLYDKLQKEQQKANRLLTRKEKLDIDISKYEKKIENAKQKTNELADELDRIAKEQLEIDGLEINPANIEKAKQYLSSLKVNDEMKAGEYQDYTLRAQPFQEISEKFDKIVDSIENGERELDILKQKYDDVDYQIQKCEANQSKYTQEIQNATNQSNGMNINFSRLEKNASKVANKFSGMLKKVGKIALALVGVRTILNLITRSFNTLAQYNTELGTKMEQMRLVLAVALEPIINWLVNMLHVVLSLINQIYSALFSIDLFGRASELWTKKMSENMASGASSAKEMKKQLAGFDEMNVLTEPNASSAGGGGGSGTQEWTLKPKLDLDLDAILQLISDTFDKIINFINQSIENFDPKEFAKSISKIIVTLLDLINRTFTDINWGELVSKLIQTILHLDWASIIGELLENIIVTSFIFPIELLLGIIDGILTTFLDFIEDPSQYEGAGEKILSSLGDGIKKSLSKLLDLFKDIVKKIFKIFGVDISGATDSITFENLGELAMKGLESGIKALKDAVVGIFTNIVNSIKQKFTDFKNAIKTMIDVGINWIKQKIEWLRSFINGFIDGFKLGIQTITQWFKDKIQDIYNFFNNIIVGMQTVVGNVVQWIKDKFNTFVNFFKGIGIAIGDFFSSAIKGAVNGVLSWVESKVNWFIDKINSVISLINKIPGVSIGRLSRISLPRLAVGGIINQPGRGVPVGGAIAGEAGREGILPLTDQRAMAELGKEIGKWININATIPVNIGNRQVARILEEITADREFATNS